MNKRRKITILFLVVMMSLMLVPMITSTHAFNNGKSTGYNFDHNKSQSELQKWYDNHYGTHDWIAEAALDAILADSSTKQKWESENGNFWTEKRTIIFLIGTEAPDVDPAKLRMTFVYVDENGKEDKVVVKGFGASDSFSKGHNIYFYPNDNIDPELRMKGRLINAAAKAVACENKVKQFLEKGYCEVAAFYMGAMLHYIGDCGSFVHTLDYSDFPEGSEPSTSEKQTLHKSFENKIQVVTKDHDNRETTFTFKKNFDVESTLPNGPQPSVFQCALFNAFNTRWDHWIASPQEYGEFELAWWIQPGTYNAVWLYNNYDFSDANTWSTNNPLFKQRIQENLDYTVICSAKAINAVASYWNPKECQECRDDKSEKPPKKSPIKSVALAISLILFIGIMAAISLPVSNLLLHIVPRQKVTA